MTTKLVEGDWDGLIAPGVNGMLGVITCLYWWGKTVQGLKDVGVVKRGGNVEEWTEAFLDVIWVLKSLIASQKDS